MDFELYTKDLSTLKNPKYKIIYTLKVYEYLLTKGIKPVDIMPHYMNKKWACFRYLITRQFCEALKDYEPDWYLK